MNVLQLIDYVQGIEAQNAAQLATMTCTTDEGKAMAEFFAEQSVKKTVAFANLRDIAFRVLGADTDAEDGVSLIGSERRRQVAEEGWSAAHDDQHDYSEMAVAASIYAAPADHAFRHVIPGEGAPISWPWGREWWKPGDGSAAGRIRELTKAGALIAAEIDRLRRIDG